MNGWMPMSVSGSTSQATRCTIMQNQTPDFPGTSADHLHHGPFNTKSRQKQIAKEKSDHNCLFGSPIWRSNFDRRFHFLAHLQRMTPSGWVRHILLTYTVFCRVMCKIRFIAKQLSTQVPELASFPDVRIWVEARS